MDELKTLLKEKIKLCASSINKTSSNEMDLREAQAVEHLSRALNYLYQIEEVFDNGRN